MLGGSTASSAGGAPGTAAHAVLGEIAMLPKRLLIALLLAAPMAHAGSWTYVGTLGETASVADGLYDVRLTLLDADTSRPRMEPVTVQGVAISGGAFTVQVELDGVLRASAGTTTGSLLMTTELSSDGTHFIAIGPSSRFDAVSAHLGVCWGSPDAASSNPGSTTATTCLLPSDLLTQMGPGGGVYELKKQVIAGGGRLVTGGSYSLTGTVGQSAVAQVSGGMYQITGGFHSAAAGPPFDLIFRSGFDN